MEFIVPISNTIVGAGDHDGPPKIGTIFGFSEGKYNIIARGDVILFYKITGASRSPPPTMGTIN